MADDQYEVTEDNEEILEEERAADREWYHSILVRVGGDGPDTVSERGEIANRVVSTVTIGEIERLLTFCGPGAYTRSAQRLFGNLEALIKMLTGTGTRRRWGWPGISTGMTLPDYLAALRGEQEALRERDGSGNPSLAQLLVAKERWNTAEAMDLVRALIVGYGLPPLTYFE